MARGVTRAIGEPFFEDKFSSRKDFNTMETNQPIIIRYENGDELIHLLP